MSIDPFVCPRCGQEEIPKSRLALERMKQGGLCQGCRAARTLRERPWLLSDFVSFWRENGFPSSDSWLRALPAACDVDPSVRPGAGGELHRRLEGVS